MGNFVSHRVDEQEHFLPHFDNLRMFNLYLLFSHNFTNLIYMHVDVHIFTNKEVETHHRNPVTPNVDWTDPGVLHWNLHLGNQINTKLSFIYCSNKQFLYIITVTAT